MGLSLILLKAFCGIYSLQKESKCTVVLCQCVSLLLLPLRLITYTPSFILGTLTYEKTPLSLG